MSEMESPHRSRSWANSVVGIKLSSGGVFWTKCQKRSQDKRRKVRESLFGWGYWSACEAGALGEEALQG